MSAMRSGTASATPSKRSAWLKSNSLPPRGRRGSPQAPGFSAGAGVLRRCRGSPQAPGYPQAPRVIPRISFTHIVRLDNAQESAGGEIPRVGGSCKGQSWLVGSDDPHGEELGAPTVGVAERTASAIHLVLPSHAAHLQRGFSESDQPGRADGVGRQYPAGRVPRDVAIERGHAGLGQLPAVTVRAEPEIFQPHRLVPAEGHIDLGDVKLPARVADAGLPVDIGSAIPARAWVHGVTPGEKERLAAHRGAVEPG